MIVLSSLLAARALMFVICDGDNHRVDSREAMGWLIVMIVSLQWTGYYNTFGLPHILLAGYYACYFAWCCNNDGRIRRIRLTFGLIDTIIVLTLIAWGFR